MTDNCETASRRTAGIAITTADGCMLQSAIMTGQSRNETRKRMRRLSICQMRPVHRLGTKEILRSLERRAK